ASEASKAMRMAGSYRDRPVARAGKGWSAAVTGAACAGARRAPPARRPPAPAPRPRCAGRPTGTGAAGRRRAGPLPLPRARGARADLPGPAQLAAGGARLALPGGLPLTLHVEVDVHLHVD